MMVVLKKETLASLALLVLAGVFLYLGFTQEGTPWQPVVSVPAVKGEGKEAGPASSSPTTKGEVKQSTSAAVPAPAEQPATPREEAGASSTSSALPLPARDPLEGAGGQELKKKSGEEFFVEYRLERDRVRSQEIQMLRELIGNPGTSAEVRNEAQERLIRITEYMEQEMQLEALLKAKGYSEACVFLQPTAVHVIVRAQALKEEEVNRIGELVARTIGRKMEEVVIIPWP